MQIAHKDASEAANRAELSNAITWQPTYYTKLIEQIQRRLAAILLNLPPEVVERKAKTESSRESMNRLLLHTNHEAITANNRLSCRVCINSLLASDPACKQLLKSNCNVPIHQAP